MASANDNFANRIALSPLSGGTASFDNTGNGNETFETTSSSAGLRSGWYSLTSTERRIFRFRVNQWPTSATVTFRFFKSSVLNSGHSLTAFEGRWWLTDVINRDAGLSHVAVINHVERASGNTDWHEIQVPPGVEITIQVGVKNTAHQGTIEIEWEEQTPPANTDWADAEEIDGETGTTSGTTVGATRETLLPAQSFSAIGWPYYRTFDSFASWDSRAKGVCWYLFTPADAGQHLFTVTPTGAADQFWLCIFRPGDTFATLEHKNWAPAGETLVTDLELGAAYYLAVVAFNNATSDSSTAADHTAWRGAYDLEWLRNDTAPNDVSDTAEELTGDSGSATQVSLEGARDELIPSPGGATVTAATTAWWKFTPATSGRFTFVSGDAPRPHLQFLYAMHHNDEGEWDFNRSDSNDPFSLQVGVRPEDPVYLCTLVFPSRANINYYDSLTLGSLTWSQDGASPTNDDFADAELITGSSGTTSGDMSYATFETGEPTAFTRPTVWYRWVAPSSGYFRFTVESDPVDSWLIIGTGVDVESFTPIAHNYDGDYPYTGDAIVVFEAEMGVEYLLQVSTFGWDDGLTFDLVWATDSPPTHDAFSSPIHLGSGESGGPTEYDSFGADIELESGEPEIDPNDEAGGTAYGRSVWHTWTCPLTSEYEWLFSTNFDGFATIFELNGAASFANLTLVGDEEVGYDDGVAITFNATGGKTYVIRMAGVGFEEHNGETEWSVESGEYVVEWSRIPNAPDNDPLDSSIDNYDQVGNLDWYEVSPEYGDTSLPSGGCKHATSIDATAQAGEPAVAGFGPERTVWFHWRPSYSGTARFWIESTDNTDMVMAVYSGGGYNPASPGTLLASDDDSGPGLLPQVDFTVSPFSSYRIQVDTKDDPGGDFEIKWTRVTSSPPANDAFADAEDVTFTGDAAVIAGTTTDATAECDEPPIDFEGPFASVWYRIPAQLVDRGIEITLRSDGDNNPGGIRANLYSGTSIDALTDVSQGDYGWVFDDDEEYVTTHQLVAGVDHYIKVEGYQDQFGDFDVDIALSSLTPPDGDDGTDPIDSGEEDGVTPGDTEGAGVDPNEPDSGGLAGTVWHRFTPKYDGVYVFQAIRPDDSWYVTSVWKGTSPTGALTPVPKTWTDSQEHLYDEVRTLNGVSLQKDVVYLIRVEREIGETWGPYDFTVTSWPEMEDWVDGPGWPTLEGSAVYTDGVLTSGYGSTGYGETWFVDEENDPRDSGIRIVSIRGKLRVPDGVTMARFNATNHLGILRVLDASEDMLFGLRLTGAANDGTNYLEMYNGDGIALGTETSFGTREKDYGGFVDVEVTMKNTRVPGPFTGDSYQWLIDVAINGVVKRVSGGDYLLTTFGHGLPRLFQFGAFEYPAAFQANIGDQVGSEEHEDWGVQWKDVTIRTRAVLGQIESTGTAESGIIAFDGFRHETLLGDVISGNPVNLEIVEVPDYFDGFPSEVEEPDWRLVRVYKNFSYVSSGLQLGYIAGSKFWQGCWFQFPEGFPAFEEPTESMILSQLSGGYGMLMVNSEGELRVAPRTGDGPWRSFCVAHLSQGDYYWVEMETDFGSPYEASCHISINGTDFGTYTADATWAQWLTTFAPTVPTYANFTGIPYTGYGTNLYVGCLGKMPVQYSLTGDVALGSVTEDVDFRIAHVCFGRAINVFPQGALETQMFDGIDSDGTHGFPDLPEDHYHLQRDGRERIWTLYNYVDDSDNPNPSVGAAPGNYVWGVPPGDAIDVVADGGGPAEISAMNAIRWTARDPAVEAPYEAWGTRHRAVHGSSQKEFYVTAEGGVSADMYVGTAWVRGDADTGAGTLEWMNFVHPGNEPLNSRVWTLTSAYQQIYAVDPPAWNSLATGATTSTENWWEGMTDGGRQMFWKAPYFLRNAEVYPRFATSSDNGASWTMLEEQAATTFPFISNDVTEGGSSGVFLNNTSAIKRIMESHYSRYLPFNDFGMASVGYQTTDHYLEYLSGTVPAEMFPRAFNLIARHGGYDFTPSTSRVNGTLWVRLVDDEDTGMPLPSATRSTSGISRIRVPIPPNAGHWTFDILNNARLRLGLYRGVVSNNISLNETGVGPAPFSWANSQRGGAFVQALQWEALIIGTPGPVPQPCAPFRLNSQLVRKV